MFPCSQALMKGFCLKRRRQGAGMIPAQQPSKEQVTGMCQLAWVAVKFQGLHTQLRKIPVEPFQCSKKPKAHLR